MKESKHVFFNKEAQNLTKLKPIAFSIFMTIGMVSIVNANTISTEALTEVVKKENAKVLNIATVSHGNSYNTYENFDISEAGLVINNSSVDSDTQLAGKVPGNSNLVEGEADIVLIDVKSTKATTLNGIIEVTGKSARVIVSNPSGINCSSCTFLSANRAVLTTGSLVLKDNALSAYKVEKGTISISGNVTFDDSPSNIDLISRDVVVAGIVHAEEADLRVTTGANEVNAENDKVTEIKGTGTAPRTSLKVEKDAEIKAKKITLVSTDAKAAFSNQGQVRGGADGFIIDNKGELLNSAGKIAAKGTVNINVARDIKNTTGKIQSSSTININTQGSKLVNSSNGNISSKGSVTIDSGELKNDASYIASESNIIINTNGKSIINDTTLGARVGIAAIGDIKIVSGIFTNNNGQIKSEGDIDIDTNTKAFNNKNSTIDTDGNIYIKSGKLDNNTARIRSVNKVTIDTNGNKLSNNGLTADTASNDTQGILSGKGGMSLNIVGLSNDKGILASEGDFEFTNIGTISNQWGQIKADGKLLFKSDSVDNMYGGIASKNGGDIVITKKLDNHFGVLFFEGEKALIKSPTIGNSKGIIKGDNIKVETETLDNDSGFIVSEVSLDVAANNLKNSRSSGYKTEMGFYIGQPDQVGGIVSKKSMTLKGEKLSSNSGRIITEKGNMVLDFNQLENASSMIASEQEMVIKANSLNNTHGTVYAKEKLELTTAELKNVSSGSLEANTLTGVIATDGITDIHITSDFNNSGVVSGIKGLNINIDGKFDNSIKSTLSGKDSFILTVKKDIVNKGTLNSDLNSTISGVNITNEKSGSLIGREGVKINASGKFVNNGRLVGPIIE
ncbi:MULTISPECIES: two-partner secretion domain-containing protein [Providencia]|uniref:two-partner secretion domain-containing protein n=1 Tax=Providencia TaxID=586 RepID=UPI000D6EE564|nr:MULTISPECIES: filamentous hemagglutinin N-terminal domain-containing protein [Providencia]MCG5291471.1 filamentous hemagglutinin N-terminal domain-containing protein [Providencia rettgeri]MDM9284932.1 filamentous hemagglutinin N-terminal domain-containing protein [Providencia rettgeri]WOB80902.1 filamentous hemagglutinin N-terminal domain-containing protein [Providencia sp. PROV114]HEE8952023.1 filamentous hemagglutinin N-terminal domain-containing protein [Providencia rettgeri]